MRVLIIALCLVSVSQGTIFRLLNRTRHRGGNSGLGQSPFGQQGVRPIILTGIQPRVQDAPVEDGGELPPGTRYTKHSQKSEKTESHSSQKSESHSSESTSYTSGGQGGFPSGPAVPQTGYVPSNTGQVGGAASQSADAAQQVGVNQSGESGVSPRFGHQGGIRQNANIRQSAQGHGGGHIRQNANINQGASGGYGNIDQNANIGQHAGFRSAPSSAANIRQTALVKQSGGHHQSANIAQNAKIRQGAGQGSATIGQTANVQQTAGSSGVGGGERFGGIGEGAEGGLGGLGGAEGGLGGDVVSPSLDGTCGTNSAYCVNVRDEGFYPSTDARGHFYRCSHCSPHFFRCGPGTAYHAVSRACL